MLLTRDAEISRAFGVIQRGFSAGQVCSWLVGLLRANDMLSRLISDAHRLPSQLCLHRGQRGQSAPPHRLGPQVLSDDVDVLVR